MNETLRLLDANALTLARVSLSAQIDRLRINKPSFVPLYMEAYFMICRMERVALEKYTHAKM